jgi:hypothetical protein
VENHRSAVIPSVAVRTSIVRLEKHGDCCGCIEVVVSEQKFFAHGRRMPLAEVRTARPGRRTQPQFPT